MKNRNREILYYTIEGYDTPNPVNHLMDGIINAILESGNRCHLIQSYRTGKNKSIPNDLINNSLFSTTIIDRKLVNKLSFIKRYIEESFFSINIIKYRKKIRKCDVILVQSTATGLAHLVLLKIIARRPIIYNVYDVFPGHAYDIGVIKSKIIYLILKKMQKFAYKFCDKIVVMCEDMEIKLLNEGVNKNKIEIIYNWFDDTKFYCIEKSKTTIFQKYNLDNKKFYLQYAGTFGQVFDEKILIDLALELKSLIDVRILLIGNGVKINYIKNKVQKLNIQNIIFLPLQPEEMVNDVYNACDMGFIPLKKGVIGYGLPSKACQLLACSKPVYNVCDKSYYAETFTKYNMGISNTNYDIKKIKNDIISLLNNPKQIGEMGNNGKDYVYTYYSKTINTKKFVRLCLTLIKEEN